MPLTLSRLSDVSSAGLVVFCALVVHFSALGNGFHYDDGHSIVRNPHIRDLGNLTEFFVNPAMYSENPGYAMFRPLVLVSTALNYHVSSFFSGATEGGYDPTGVPGPESGHSPCQLAVGAGNSISIDCLPIY